MNAEHLLDAVGLLDDDLIREAEEYQPPRRDYSTWTGLAASFAVILTLGYALTHLNLGMGGGAAPENQVSGGAAGAPAGSSGWTAEAPPSEPAQSPEGSEYGGGLSDNAVSQEPNDGEHGIWIDSMYYVLLGEMAEELPEDCISLGTLSKLYPDAPSPATDAEEYVGLEVWQSLDGALIYVPLPGGNYALGELVQP